VKSRGVKWEGKIANMKTDKFMHFTSMSEGKKSSGSVGGRIILKLD
jgi:hypothetical protein